MKTALITGINGQDGAYLANFLLSLGYRVIGGKRRTSGDSLWRLEKLGISTHPRLMVVNLDITDFSNCLRVVSEYRPHELYNLAAQSHVGLSFSQPEATTSINALGVQNLLEALRVTGCDTKFYQAGTSELFGKVTQVPQTESTAFYPRSPYGVSKLYAHWLTVNYRESYGIFAACGILFNHESPLRTKDFVTRKITSGFAEIAAGSTQPIKLGNLDARRDWGYAKEYVVGMWKMLQTSAPETYVLATSRSETVREFVRLSAASVGIDVDFVGSGVFEQAIDRRTGAVVVRVDESLYRPAEVDLLIGCAEKAAKELNWVPSTKLEGLVELMIKADLQEVGVSAISKRRSSTLLSSKKPAARRISVVKPLNLVAQPG
jgi:GDPmannose 4,6-dehydratase